MKRIMVCVFLVIAFFISLPGVAYRWDSLKEMIGRKMPLKPLSVKVLIVENADKVQVDVKGGFRVYDPVKNKRLTFGFWGKNFLVVPDSEGLKWGQLFPDIFHFVIIPDNVEGVTEINGMVYTGWIDVYQISGKISIVNDAPIEDYVKCMMALQINSEQPDEVLAAVAIVERTNAYYQSLRGKHLFWDVDGHNVNYKGAVCKNTHINKMVDRTKGFVMLHESNKPFPAQWTEHCAGKTASYSIIFRENALGPQHGVASQVAFEDRSKTKWSVSVDLKEMAKMVNLPTITDIALYRDKNSEKVYALRLHNGEEYSNIDFLTLRNKLGKDQLKSNDFNVSILKDKIVFSGYGKGNGVGLCLYSANKLSYMGKEAHTILKEFFPSVVVEFVDKNKEKD